MFKDMFFELLLFVILMHIFNARIYVALQLLVDSVPLQGVIFDGPLLHLLGAVSDCHKPSVLQQQPRGIFVEVAIDTISLLNMHAAVTVFNSLDVDCGPSLALGTKTVEHCRTMEP